MKPTEVLPEDIWDKIQRLPFMVAIGMEGAGNSGPAGSARERRESVLSILGAREAYPDNIWIRGILPEAEGEEGQEAALTLHDKVLEKMQSMGLESVQQVWDRSIHCIEEVFPVLEEHAKDSEVEDFRIWLLEIANRVARSAKERDFLGVGGQRFSPEEQLYYNRLTKALQNP